MIVVAAGRGKPGGGGLFPGFFPGDALRAMALTLRPSDVDRSRWIAFDGGIPIGRIYQRHTPASADVAWFWSITSYVEPRGAAHERDHGHARRREGSVSGHLGAVAVLGGQSRVRLPPRLKKQTVADGYV
jgi:hypothetical protein